MVGAGSSLEDFDATLEIWIDDLQAGSGSLNDGDAASDANGTDDSDQPGFEQHLKVLE